MAILTIVGILSVLAIPISIMMAISSAMAIGDMNKRGITQTVKRRNAKILILTSVVSAALFTFLAVKSFQAATLERDKKTGAEVTQKLDQITSTATLIYADKGSYPNITQLRAKSPTASSVIINSGGLIYEASGDSLYLQLSGSGEKGSDQIYSISILNGEITSKSCSANPDVCDGSWMSGLKT